jgi:hypothetical protein
VDEREEKEREEERGRERWVDGRRMNRTTDVVVDAHFDDGVPATVRL